ncbi:hypothetical protein DLAC_04835 [Tieghemostelium lacteum]|uniref:Uncharacterized protein n=1 Tax=Tieghemostelium lacteum TaxID=361077 RepID=A0A151ZJ56_TIELA|nr:hypothetical protein DLAC_04835 [Tieghemostelium lacteum]|eukprot:KYQ93947.1 hypothetical protein DLAC_04835 [Tieghemostelium lacteum]
MSVALRTFEKYKCIDIDSSFQCYKPEYADMLEPNIQFIVDIIEYQQMYNCNIFPKILDFMGKKKTKNLVSKLIEQINSRTTKLEIEMLSLIKVLLNIVRYDSSLFSSNDRISNLYSLCKILKYLPKDQVKRILKMHIVVGASIERERTPVDFIIDLLQCTEQKIHVNEYTKVLNKIYARSVNFSQDLLHPILDEMSKFIDFCVDNGQTPEMRVIYYVIERNDSKCISKLFQNYESTQNQFRFDFPNYILKSIIRMILEDRLYSIKNKISLATVSKLIQSLIPSSKKFCLFQAIPPHIITNKIEYFSFKDVDNLKDITSLTYNSNIGLCFDGWLRKLNRLLQLEVDIMKLNQLEETIKSLLENNVSTLHKLQIILRECIDSGITKIQQFLKDNLKDHHNLRDLTITIAISPYTHINRNLPESLDLSPLYSITSTTTIIYRTTNYKRQ